MTSFKRSLLIWIWNLINAIFGGVATAGVAILGGQALGANNFTVRQLVTVALSGGLLSGFNYVRENRLPKLEDTPEETSIK